MISVYILIIAYGGAGKIDMHDYGSLATCQQVAAWYTNFNNIYQLQKGSVDYVYGSCLPMGQKTSEAPQYVFTIFPAPGSGYGGTLVTHDFNDFNDCTAAYSFVIALPYAQTNLWPNCLPK